MFLCTDGRVKILDLDRVRVTADLVRASDGSRRWSGTYDRDVTSVLATQAEIARAVVDELRLHLLPAGPDDGKAEPVPPEVRNANSLGRAFSRRLTGRDLERAVEAFERALRQAPRYAPAWAGLGRALYLAAAAPDSDREIPDGYARALDASDRAIAIDPRLADGCVIRGVIRSRVEHRRIEGGGAAPMRRWRPFGRRRRARCG